MTRGRARPDYTWSIGARPQVRKSTSLFVSRILLSSHASINNTTKWCAFISVPVPEKEKKERATSERVLHSFVKFNRPIPLLTP